VVAQQFGHDIFVGPCAGTPSGDRTAIRRAGCRAAAAAAINEYDKCMKRITVSLPDELAEKVRRAAGGERRVSSYVAAALEDYAERENLAEVLAGWNAETAVPEEIQRQVRDELDRAGLTSGAGRDDRLAG
jgi:Arc/MetJ-type ribon-helix-helix transcriptional regulator